MHLCSLTVIKRSASARQVARDTRQRRCRPGRHSGHLLASLGDALLTMPRCMLLSPAIGQIMCCRSDKV